MADSDGDALLRAIIRHPDDDTPRLVYADWLEENSRPEEAEFLRVQCRLASVKPDDPEYPALLDRDEELRLWLTAHVPGPRPTFPGGLWVDGGSYWWNWTHRGFPRFLEFDGYQRPGVKAIRSLASAVKRAFNVLPTRWLVVRAITIAQLATLLKQPVMSGLTELTVQLMVGQDEANEAARLLANCKHLRNLRGLALAFAFGDAGCEALAGASWGGLDWFSPDCNELTPAGVRVLAAAPWVRSLHSLTLDYGLPEDAFETLVRLPVFSQLHTLDLAENDFSEAAWASFAQTRTFPALTELRHSRGHLSGTRATTLMQAAGFSLRVLRIPQCGVGPRVGEALATAPWADGLRVLDLSLNSLEAGEVKAIASCKSFARLEHLDLSHNAIGPTGLSAITSNPALRKLRSLRLQGRPRIDNRGLTTAHFDRFLSKLDMPDLRQLDLSGRPIGPTAARRLTEPKFTSLTRLGLNGCKLSNASVKALITAPALRNLLQLELNGNQLSTGVEQLANRSVLPRLASCSLSDNVLPGTLARKLRRRAGVRV